MLSRVDMFGKCGFICVELVMRGSFCKDMFCMFVGSYFGNNGEIYLYFKMWLLKLVFL